LRQETDQVAVAQVHVNNARYLLEDDRHCQTEGKASQHRFGNKRRHAAEFEQPGQQEKPTRHQHQTDRQRHAQARVTIGQRGCGGGQYRRRRRRSRNDGKTTGAKQPVAQQTGK
jgi:hypothetical protein